MAQVVSIAMERSQGEETKQAFPLLRNTLDSTDDKSQYSRIVPRTL